MFLNYNFKNGERKEEHTEIEWLSTALQVQIGSKWY